MLRRQWDHMRDLLIYAIVFGLLPVVLMHPWVGAMMWTWLSIMNPHRLAWGPAFDFPFAAVVAGATVLGIVVTRDERRFPVNPVTVVLLIFIAWMCLTSVFAIYPDASGSMFRRVMKIQFMVFVTLCLVLTRKHLHIFLWVIVASLGFYGLKGGRFTLIGAGEERVLGPPDSFITGNNELALALIMTIPLIKYLHDHQPKRWLRWALAAAMILCALASLGSHSRGAFLAIAAMGFFLWIRSSRKLVSGIALVSIAIALVAFMPAKWVERMQTLENVEFDSSATGRFNAWTMAFNLARDRPLGGGFEVITPELFQRYAPDPNDIHAAHSIYFQVLGEHGFVGLALYLLFWFLTWQSANWLRKKAVLSPDTRWAADLAAMIQVGLVGYFVGGAFLSLSYFDLPYNMMIMIVVSRVIVESHLRSSAAAAPTPAADANLPVPTVQRKHA